MKNWNGSYTIEASFILPIIFAVMTAVLFFGFYLHDDTIIHIAAYEIACYGAEKAETIEQIKNYGKTLLTKTLLATELKDIEINLADKKVEVTIKGEFESPFFSSEFLGFMKKGIVVKKTAQKSKASAYIRRINIIIEKLKGMWEEE